MQIRMSPSRIIRSVEKINYVIFSDGSRLKPARNISLGHKIMDHIYVSFIIIMTIHPGPYRAFAVLLFDMLNSVDIIIL
jgi:hypothetical protein